MKDVWVLSIKALFWTEPDYKQFRTMVYALDSFEEAKAKLKSKLYELAFSKNSMFDGNGNMIYFKNYLDNLPIDNINDYILKESLLKKYKLSKIYDALIGIFAGKECDVSKLDLSYNDGFIAVDTDDGKLRIQGCDEDGCNGYDAFIVTDMYDMSKEKDYWLYVEDAFGQWGRCSRLNIDLLKSEKE